MTRAALTISAVAVLLTPALLAAHAHLTRSEPAANERLERAPRLLRLWFSEDPEVRFTRVQLLDSTGTPIALAAVAKTNADPSGVVVPLVGNLNPGRYTVAWRTAASDGHATTGRFTFSVATRDNDTSRLKPVPNQAPPATSVQARPNEIISARVAQRPLGTAEHWALLVAMLTVIGAIMFRGLVLTRSGWDAALVADASDRARRLAQGALALALVASVTRLAAETSLMSESKLAMRTMWDVAHETAWGRGWLVGAAGIVVAGVGLVVARRVAAAWLVAALGALAMAVSQSLTGHAGARADWFTVSVSSDVVHLLAAGTWVGGLVAVLLAGLPAVRRYGEADRPRYGSRVVRAYHDVALPSVIVVGITGLANSWLRFGRISEIWTSTYGRVLIVKVFLFLILASFGYYHWRTVVAPNWVAESAGRFRRTALLELVVGALVLMATALLVSTSTPDAH